MHTPPPAPLDDLLDLTQSGSPVEPRLKDAGTAASIYDQLVSDDATASTGRSRVDAMFDGEAPYDSQQLKAMGQGGRANLNFNTAQRLLDGAQAGYVDVVTSTEFLVDVKTRLADAPDLPKGEIEAILNEELTATIRDWSEFLPRFLSLSTEFIKHGVGVAFFPDRFDWRFDTTGLKDYKFPRGTRSSEDSVDICFSAVDYSIRELYAFIEREDTAASEGWNVDAVKDALMRACRTDKTANSISNWEHQQMLIKNADSSSNLRSKSVRVVHCWVKEMDGSVSHYIFEDSDKRKKDHREFLFEAPSKFGSFSEVLVLFPQGVGNNGYLHSIRGLGQRIFPAVQTLNRLLCQTVDAAAVAGGVLVRPNSFEDLRDLALQTFGPFTAISPNVDVIENRSVPNLTNSMLPVSQMMQSMLRDQSDMYSTSEATKGSPYRNQLQVRAQLEEAARLSMSQLNLFYQAFDRLVRQVVRRLVDGPKSDPAVREFYERCELRGVSREMIKSIDHRATKAVRAIGDGNPAARLSILDELDRERVYYDEVGNRNLTFDRTAARIGYSQASRYVQRNPSEPRGSQAETDAAIENALLQSGTPVQVLPAQLHGIHLNVHIPLANQFIDAVVGGQFDPTTQLDTLEAFATHLQEHAQAAANDPTLQAYVSAALDSAAKLGQIIENSERSIQADGGQPGGETDGKAEEAMRLAQVKEDIMRRESEVKMQIKAQEAEQDRQLADFKAAADVARTQTQ